MEEYIEKYDRVSRYVLDIYFVSPKSSSQNWHIITVLLIAVCFIFYKYSSTDQNSIFGNMYLETHTRYHHIQYEVS